MNWAKRQGPLLLVCGLLMGSFLGAEWIESARAQRDGATPVTEPNVQADVTHLKDIVPPASHPMVEVGYHTANMWFAVQKKNWPLANYYWGETRNRLRWETKLNPGPKAPTGEPLDMKGTLDGIENGSLGEVKKTIDAKDANAFTSAYKHLIEDCYSCHKAAGRPYLRPMIPTEPGAAIINPDPDATWPQ